MESAKDKVEFYLNKAKPLFADVNVVVPKTDFEKVGKEFLQMTMGYYTDAIHFYENGEYLNALAALEYAEGWLDAGKRLGILE